ncbi:MAG: WcbI family polysaccharide biosynthesis putative acetyltransferase, partial [Alphaproteobacteria bacterium]
LMNYLWPLAVHDPRVEDLPPNIRTSFPYTLSDTLVVKLAREGVPESEFIDAYMGHDIPRMFKLDRLRAFNAAKMRAIDRMSTFPIWDHIEARNASEQMFRTLNHPSGALMAELARRVAESLPLVTDMKVVEQRVAEIAAGPGVQNVDAPVHPQVAEHFDVAWAKRDAYHFWDEGVFSFRENLLRLYRLERDTGVMDGLRLLSTGKHREAAELLTEVVERRPRSAKAREALASAHELLKQPEPAAANRAIAFEIDPTAKRADRAVRSLALAGRRDEANRLLDRAQALLGDGGADMAMAKIWMLANEGKPQEAHDNAEAASRLYADPELYLLLSKMRLTNGLLTESVEAMERAYYLSGYRDDYVRHLERARSDAASRQAVLDNTKRRQEEAEARRDASVKAQQTRQAAMNAAKEQRDAARAAAIDAAARRAEAVRAEAEANRSAKEDAQREAQAAREAARQAAEEENRCRAEAKQAEAEQKRAAQEEARRQAQAAREAVAEENRIRAEAQRAEAEAKRAAQ